jgi:histone-lysine N-methyltransferase SETMAR
VDSSTLPLPRVADDRVPIHVKPIHNIGLGAYYDGNSQLERGTFICLYAGEYLTTSEANSRWATTTRKEGEGNYILTLRLPNQRIHIDPRYRGNVGRFFNHSCDPTCVVQVVRWGGDSIWPRAAIFVRPLFLSRGYCTGKRGLISRQREI